MGKSFSQYQYQVIFILYDGHHVVVVFFFLTDHDFLLTLSRFAEENLACPPNKSTHLYTCQNCVCKAVLPSGD